MAELAQWLEDNEDILIQEAVAELSQDEAQKSQVVETVIEFFDSLKESVRTQNLDPLSSVLEHWISSSSAPTVGELTSLVPVLTRIKQVNAEQIQRLCPPREAVEFLIALDAIYNPAITYLSRLEVDTLMADMRRELYEAQKQLERLDKSKTDFVAVAAHELRTPITLVEGYTNMLATSVKGVREDPNGRMLLEGIDSGVKRLREIIRDMIDVSLISLDMIQLHLQPTWLHQLMDALENSMRAALVERRMELIIERNTIPRNPTYADPERLLDVLQKIVSNAIKYTPDGGKIVIAGRELTGFTDVMVIDNGIGISANDLPRIFTMFSSVGDSSLHSSSKTKFRGGGPGLGLFISKGVLEAHGGNIWAESPGYDEKLCPGSTFHIMIPMRTAPQDDKIKAVFDRNS
jgi:signal transduction histidine kinase